MYCRYTSKFVWNQTQYDLNGKLALDATKMLKNLNHVGVIIIDFCPLSMQSVI